MSKIYCIELLCGWSVAARAQQGLTESDYARAESMLTYNTEPLVDHGQVRPNWLPDGRFWFRDLTAQGSEFILVDPAKKTRSAAFDHQKLAAALSTASGSSVDASHLPFTTFMYTPDGAAITFRAGGKRWKYGLSSGQCTEAT